MVAVDGVEEYSLPSGGDEYFHAIVCINNFNPLV